MEIEEEDKKAETKTKTKPKPKSNLKLEPKQLDEEKAAAFELNSEFLALQSTNVVRGHGDYRKTK